MIPVCTPYSTDKNLGRAYNRMIQALTSFGFVCVIDYDVMFLTPDAISLIEQYTKNFPDTGIFTCFTNRLHPLSDGQLYARICSENDSIRHHIDLAEKQKKDMTVSEINHPIGGFLMVIRTKVWQEIKFNENKKCLGVDNDFSKRVLDAGYKILRMNGLYVWHSYRLVGGYRDKKHLL